MLTTLLLGSIQLILFFGLVVGLIMWLLSKMFGFQVNFTPESLWRDQQQFIDQDPVYAINEENKKIL